MKKLFIAFIGIFFFACNSEDAIDCLQTSGNIITVEVDLPEFTKIDVHQGVELIVATGDDQRVEIESGENLMNDISAVVEDGKLILRDDNSCNYFRDYDITKIYVTAPNITEIRSSTSKIVRSEGILTFPNLTLYCENFEKEDEYPYTDGSFDIEADCNSLRVVTNGVSSVILKGETETLNITLAGGDTRLMAENLIAQNVSIFQRSSNDILVYPVESLTGTIYSTGDVLSYNRPTTVDVEELYKGELIFID